jgi:hypothetical protein
MLIAILATVRGPQVTIRDIEARLEHNAGLEHWFIKSVPPSQIG